ncbi:PIR Superfamily Protein [Plasmodium ovale wallikeri]|uniref:PIR Superfamily Protein n=1 Tax=Plasmodium ovale wallikeri TaxID=864142 RepID=A0A1A9ANE1_PLAOA|nr:PIR Superfamily Protein [Plasmodium ovale wallikeri]
MSLENGADFLELVKDDITLQSAHSNKMYKIFDEEVKEADEKDICKDFETLTPSDTWGKDLCNKIYKNSNYVSSTKYYKGHKDRCLHYTFWVYGEIAKKSPNDSDYKAIKNVIEKFTDRKPFYTGGFIENNCQYDFKGKDFNELKIKIEKKYMHDYFRNFSFIKKGVSICNDENYEKYEKYLNSIIKLYDKYKKGECSEYYYFLLYECDDYFSLDEKFNPKTLLSTLKKRKSENFPINEKQEYLDESDQNLGSTNQTSDVKLDCYKGFKLHEEKVQREDGQGDEIRKVNYYSLICRDENTGDAEKSSALTTFNFSNYQMIFNGVFALLGGLLLFFLFYKFTPFGSWMRKGKKGENEDTYMFHEDNVQELLDHKLKYSSMNTNGRRLRITYHTT